MRALLFGLFVLLSSTFTRICRADHGAVSPESAARAEQLFHEGTRAFDAAEYAEAYKSLRAAWELAPSYRTAAAVGQVELQIEEFKDAAFHLSYCLRHYPQDGDPAVRSHVEEGLEQARTHVAALRVRVSVEGAEVKVDGTPVGTSPLDGLLFVNPGKHMLAASLQGYRSSNESVDAPVRSTLDVSLTLESERAPAANAASAPPPVAATLAPPEEAAVPPSSQGLTPTAWVLLVGGSLTAAALATTIVFDLKGHSAADDLSAAKADVSSGCSKPSGPDLAACARVQELADARNTDNQIAILGAIVTGALAAATAGTAIYANSREHPSRAVSRRPFVRVTAGLSGGGFVVGAPF